MVHPPREPAPRIPTSPMDPMSALYGPWTCANWVMDDLTARQSRRAQSKQRYRDGRLKPDRPTRPPPGVQLAPRLRLPDIERARAVCYSDAANPPTRERDSFTWQSTAAAAFADPSNMLNRGEQLPSRKTRFPKASMDER